MYCDDILYMAHASWPIFSGHVGPEVESSYRQTSQTHSVDSVPPAVPPVTCLGLETLAETLKTCVFTCLPRHEFQGLQRAEPRQKLWVDIGSDPSFHDRRVAGQAAPPTGTAHHVGGQLVQRRPARARTQPDTMPDTGGTPKRRHITQGPAEAKSHTTRRHDGAIPKRSLTSSRANVGATRALSTTPHHVHEQRGDVRGCASAASRH